MISIIVPVFNGSHCIHRCLQSLVNQEYDHHQYEIIVVDDGSTDSTVDIVIKNPMVRLISQENKGPAAARNTGAKHARGDVLLFTDADCVASKGWLSEMMRPLNENIGVVGVKGTYRTKQKGITARFVQLEYEDKYDVMKRAPFVDFIDTYAAAYKKDVFLNAGGFDENFPVACAEDVDLSFRLSRQGNLMVFNPHAWVYHTHPDRIKDYIKKKYKFAYWRVQALRNAPDKILKDSHTPQVMKLQVLLFPVMLLSIFGGFLFPRIALFWIIVYFASAMPFVLKAIQKDTTVGILSPIFLFLRSGAQSAGLIGGLLRRRRMKC